jgi:hypothetical protein
MMRLVSLHLSLDKILWGLLLLEDTDEPEGHVIQVNVRQVERQPGYELYSPENQVLEDLTVPATREANRMVQTLLVPATEVAQRERAVRAVIHSGYLEGYSDDMAWQAQLWMYARGEIGIDQVRTSTDVLPERLGSPVSGIDPVEAASVPDAWWQSTKARIRQHLLAITLSVTETAAALQIPADEVDHLLGSNRLTSFDLDGEERIPAWQLLGPTVPGFGDPSVILPGLDVLYAAAPQQLLNAAPMTEFMTTPRPFLTVNGEAKTPLLWLQEGRPLATIIALFRNRQWR